MTQLLDTTALKSPYPFFGGKSAVASLVWDRFGTVTNYVEPFFGSGAVLLASPTTAPHETVNDMNGMIANFWRATQHDPEAVARAMDFPVNECDLHAWHMRLVQQQSGLTEQLMGNPDFYDAVLAGRWCWGICQWIGSGWCSGQGPWRVTDEGRLVDSRDNVLWRQLPHLGDAGQGINRKRPHLGNAGMGINRQLPGEPDERGACDQWSDHLRDMMRALRDRLRRVRVCCGDWTRVCGPTPTTKLGLTGVFLDPPYRIEGRDDVYDNHDAHADGSNSDVLADVVRWAIARSDDPDMRIAVCGYYEDGLFPDIWECVRWKAKGGYGSQGDGQGRDNAHREAIWFSPHCARPQAVPDLFAIMGVEV